MADENTFIKQLNEAETANDTDIMIIEGEETEKISFLSLFNVIKTKLALKAAAFMNVANNDTTTTEGYVADARSVKDLGIEIDELNTKISNTKTKYVTDKQTISVASGTTAVSATLCAAPENGLYMINVSVSFSSNSSGFRRAGLDTQLISYQIPAAPGYPTNIPIDQTVYLAKGTDLKIWLMQNSGSTLDVTVQAKYSYIKL